MLKVSCFKTEIILILESAIYEEKMETNAVYLPGFNIIVQQRQRRLD